MKQKKKANSFNYDAKSEKVFCESIPKEVPYRFQEVQYTWDYSEVHTRDKYKEGKTIEKKYTPDVNFKQFDLELKGYFRPDAKTRMVMVRKMYPDADIRIAFQKDLLLRKGGKRRYSDWARINGFKWCIASTFQELPKEWQEEILEEKSDAKS